MVAVGLTLETSVIKTYFIGIDVEQSPKATNDIVGLTLAGGENAEFFQITNVKIEEIFEKIRLGLGIYQESQMHVIANDKAALIGVQTRQTPVITVKQQNYVVLFNLDMSGSMSGERWRKVCASVEKFIAYLGNGDLVGGIIFNDKVKIIKSPEEPKKQAYTQTSKPTTTQYGGQSGNNPFNKAVHRPAPSYQVNKDTQSENWSCILCNIF